MNCWSLKSNLGYTILPIDTDGIACGRSLRRSSGLIWCKLTKSSSLHTEVQLRLATFDDFTRKNSLGKKVWLQQKDFWAMNSKGELEYYRLDVIDAGVNSIFGMLKGLVRVGRIYVVDVEGKREEFFCKK